MPPESESSAPVASMTPRMFCKGCGYALVGLKSRVCPECGRGFDPGNRRTFATRRPRGWVWRWGRRALALVLLMVLAAGAGLGWLWWGWHSEQETIGRLEALHQRFWLKPTGPIRLRSLLGKRFEHLTNRVYRVDVASLEAGEIGRLHFECLSHVEMLEMSRCEITSSDLSKLGGLRKLGWLKLHYLRIKNPDLGFLEKLTTLQDLELIGKWVADAGFAHIANLNRLKFLNLRDTGARDADLQYLQGLSSLEGLNLMDNPFREASLARLQGLKSLKVLLIDRNADDSPGLTILKGAVPHLTIRKDEWDH